MRTINALATIAYRDFVKLLRDRTRILATLIFPVIFIGILGGSLQANLSESAGYDFLTFVFTGVLAQTLFQSTASGLIYLIQDRTSDFSQEIFISPVSRYIILLGKIIGETLVASTQGIGIILFGVMIGVPLPLAKLLAILPFLIMSALFGGAFGLLVLSNLSSERAANQIFPFLLFPQFFLAGVFSPIKNLPPILNFLSIITPMRYPVDLIRGIYYAGTPEYSKLVLTSPLNNFLIISVAFGVFLTLGTFLFVRNERNK